MADNLQKRPAKGILKNSSSFDKQEAHSNAKKAKETKWDEMNIIATLHPPDKDYGHMKIDEPKTPFSYDGVNEYDGLDAAQLAQKIREASMKKANSYIPEETEEDDDDADLTPEERLKRKEFQQRRKKHYNEFYAVQLAKKLLEEDEDDDDDEPLPPRCPSPARTAAPVVPSAGASPSSNKSKNVGKKT